MKKEVTIVISADEAIRAIGRHVARDLEIPEGRKITHIGAHLDLDGETLREVRVTLTIEDR